MPKTYVCSDIHAHLDVLEEALDSIGRTDKLYILGDVIDKGPDRLDVLKRVMNDPRCELIIGNHELMMLQFVQCAEYEDYIPSEIFDEIYENWIMWNGGWPSIEAFYNENGTEQRQIMSYLKTRPVVKFIEVSGKKFCLVHAYVKDAKNANIEDVMLSDIGDEKYPFLYDWKNDYVWGRNIFQVPGHISIVGHTASQHYGHTTVLSYNDVWFDIDCGLAYNRPDSTLALMCLDDMSVRYFSPKKLVKKKEKTLSAEIAV